ncbi:cytochrome c oxidase assembly protein [Thermomonospora umbrina]|uniref:Putative copper resistance protein D n=1 Tax=Thermomonospora umbrina TaxID=111806 RepID=A0A3D9STB4_9ACTN|nr:cytochrome c oxidase assembly protein [Thermomonospora umbrina]REE99038.1 putative copper resistance protein D [Thermomonospora umbrina]
MTALLAVRAGAPPAVPGLSGEGAVTRWGLPLAKTAMDGAGVVTVGAALMAVVLLPGADGRLGEAARAWTTVASRAALAWAVAAVVTLVFRASSVFGVPVTDVLGGRFGEFVDFASGNAPGLGPAVVAVLSAAASMLARGAATAGRGAWTLAVASAALLPPALTGHSASSPDHDLASTAVAVHVVAPALWVGGLLAVCVHALRRRPDADVAAGRFSRMALWCYLVLAVAGVAAAVSRLPSPADLVAGPYGMLILVKCVLLSVLGLIGHRHRTSTLPRLRAGNPGAFVRLAVGELTVMGVAIGVAVALSETPPPETPLPADPLTRAVGFPVPPPITVVDVALRWRLDLAMCLIAAVFAGLYAAGVLRLRRDGVRWPVRRTLAWCAGVLLLVVVTQSGLAKYARVMFSMHLLQNMALAGPVPLLLLLGSPLTLARRALRPAAIPGDRGPREWLAALSGSRAARFSALPPVAAVISIAAVYAPYTTPLYETAMEIPLGHSAMSLGYLALGCLCLNGLLGSRAARAGHTSRRTPYSVIQKSNSMSRSRTARAPQGPPTS